MIVDAYLLCWNEKEIMPFVVKHYQRFCDNITILDNYSTDGSDEFARSLGCEVVKFGNKFFDDEENRMIKNECWKSSNADWVIVADFDEALFDCESMHISLQKHKDKCVTIIKTIGWQIMSNEMPKENLTEITNGYEFSNYAKSIIFNPKEITSINYNAGAHRCSPSGNVMWSEDYLYVMHYKHIGGVERTIKRYKEYQPRMSKNNRKNGWGVHYNRTPASLRHEWNERMEKSKPLI